VLSSLLQVSTNRLLETKKKPPQAVKLSNQQNEATPMNKKNITPNPQQPVDRIPTGQLPTALAELSEESLGSPILVSFQFTDGTGKTMSCFCSYDGDDAE
jgi:bacteriocin leader peptide (microcyclamide/patellamide family)